MLLTFEKRRELLQELTDEFWGKVSIVPSDEQKAMGYFLAELKGMFSLGLDKNSHLLNCWYFNDIDTSTL